MPLRHALNSVIEGTLRRSRRLDRFYRDRFDRTLRPPLSAFTQLLIHLTREKDRLGPAEERMLEGEAEMAKDVAASMRRFAEQEQAGKAVLRGGSTKTHGLLRARFEILGGLPPALAKGLFAAPRSFPAWVRIAGPGPTAPADLDDDAILSLSVKVMGVDGPKLLDDERHTQDFTAISAPTFTTPDLRERVKLQRHIADHTAALYFLDPRDSHLLDAVMQGLYARAHGNPLDLQYWSCVPYLHGEGQAVKFTFRPRVKQGTPIPARPGPNYLREAMAETLRRRDVLIDVLAQLQTHPRRMPIENASVIWPRWLSPWRLVARLHIPRQIFDTPAQLQFDRLLTFDPWHCLPAHRPLGSQNRVRRLIYDEARTFRAMRGDAHYEPTGEERFDGSGVPPLPTSTPVGRPQHL